MTSKEYNINLYCDFCKKNKDITLFPRFKKKDEEDYFNMFNVLRICKDCFKIKELREEFIKKYHNYEYN